MKLYGFGILAFTPNENHNNAPFVVCASFEQCTLESKAFKGLHTRPMMAHYTQLPKRYTIVLKFNFQDT